MPRLSQSFLIAAITLAGGIGAGLVFPIMPALGLELGIPGFMIGVILSANRVSRLLFNFVAGGLYARLGPRLTMAGALAIEAVGMVMFSVALVSAWPTAWLLAGRFVNGIGMAFLVIGAQAAVLAGSDHTNRGKRTAAFRTAFNASIPGGLILGGVLADTYSNNAAFLVGAAVSAFGMGLAFLLDGRSRPPEPPGARKTLAQDSYRSLFTSPHRVALIASWIYSFFVFLTVQGALLSTLVLLVQERGMSVFGLDAQGTSSIAMTFMVGAAALFTFAFGSVLDRLRLRSTLLFPCLIGLALGFFCLAQAQSVGLLFFGSVLTGLSYNFITVAMMALLGDTTTEAQHAPAVAVFQSAGDVGGIIGPMLGIELALHWGIAPLYLSLGGLTLLCLLVALWLWRHERAIAFANS
ncbi:hypothetical protein CKO11_02300 [Rhodobacter sp. TJ_12]|uniref:MFS transporter n=1 Tax=Rhodobacter sp. TJ_12 TaxID=2029399 RepID=UPI001CC06F68|nr:MFS transporter [Rhodobacter sp. TJ_12]MBZ4021293.1 hypothetical protein [Rhodobacter sp. TJ_12]